MQKPIEDISLALNVAAGIDAVDELPALCGGDLDRAAVVEDVARSMSRPADTRSPSSFDDARDVDNALNDSSNLYFLVKAAGGKCRFPVAADWPPRQLASLAAATLRADFQAILTNRGVLLEILPRRPSPPTDQTFMVAETIAKIVAEGVAAFDRSTQWQCYSKFKRRLAESGHIHPTDFEGALRAYVATVEL